MGFVRLAPNVTGCEKLSLSQDLIPGFWLSRNLSTEVFRPDVLTDNHTLVNIETLSSEQCAHFYQLDRFKNTDGKYDIHGFHEMVVRL